MIDTNMSRSYILQQRRIHPGVRMSRTIWNKFPNTIKQADNLISSKYEFYWTMLNQHSIFQNSKKIFYLFIWWLLGQIHENVGISIIWKDFNRFWEIISIDSCSNWALPCPEFFSHWLRQILRGIGILMLSCQLPTGRRTLYLQIFQKICWHAVSNFLPAFFRATMDIKVKNGQKPLTKKSDWFPIWWWYKYLQFSGKRIYINWRTN